MTPQKYLYPNMAKRDFSNVTQVTDLEIRRLSWITLVGPTYSGVLKIGRGTQSSEAKDGSARRTGSPADVLSW